MKDYKKQIGSRIKYLREKLNMSQDTLAKKVGYTSQSSRSTINKVEMGINDITQSKLPLYAKALNTNIGYLLGITDEIHLKDIKNKEKRNIEKKNILINTFNNVENYNLAQLLSEREKALIKEYQVLNEQGKDKADERVHELTEIPRYVNYEITENNIFDMDLYDLPVSAGTGIYLCDESKSTIQVKKTATAIKANFALRISGDSMMPAFDDGDIILVKSVPCVEKGEIGIFVINSNSYVKKFGGDRLISLNSNYKDIIFSEYDTICCLGKVLGKAEILQG